MLKTDVLFLMCVLLVLMNGDLPPYIANLLAFIAGMAIKTIPEIIEQKIKGKDIIKRLSIYSGLIVAFYLWWEDFKPKFGFWWIIMAVTLFGELIRALALKYGAKYITDKAKEYE